MGSGASFLAPSQAQPSSAQASPAHHAGQVSPAQAQLTNRKPNPARPAQVRPGQATAEPSPPQAVVRALPKLCQRLFLTGFRGAILGRQSAPFLLRFWNRQGTQPSLSPAHKPQAQPSQTSTGQARPGHSRAQPSPSRGVGLAKAVLKAFSYRIQIKPSLAQPRPAQPTTQARSAQPKPSSQTASPVQPDQHRSGQARPQPSPAQPKPLCGPCQSSAKGFFLPDSEVPFSAGAPFLLRFWPVWGRRAAAFRRFGTLVFGPVFGAFPAAAAPGCLEPKLRGLALGGPAQPSPNLGVGVGKALPKPFLTGFRGAILGRRNAPFLVHFWLVWGRRAAAFRRFGTLVFGPVFGAFPGLSSIPIALVPRQSPAQPSAQPLRFTSVQPSPAQALVWALPKLCQRLFLTGFRCCVLGRRNAPFLVGVFGRFGAAVPLRFAVLERWFLDLFLVLSQQPLRLAVWSLSSGALLWGAQPSPAQTLV